MRYHSHEKVSHNGRKHYGSKSVMRQDRDEPIRAYGARLKGQASVCKFTQQCAGCRTDVDYTEAILKDVLCRGLEDTEIQMNLLGDKNQDMT